MLSWSRITSPAGTQYGSGAACRSSGARPALHQDDRFVDKSTAASFAATQQVPRPCSLFYTLIGTGPACRLCLRSRCTVQAGARRGVPIYYTPAVHVDRLVTTLRPLHFPHPPRLRHLLPPFTMRPLPGGDPPPSSKPRSPKSTVADASVGGSGPSNHVPTTFFMRTEEDLQHSMQASQNTDPTNRQRESTFGIQSLADTLEDALGSENRPGDGKRDNVPPHTTSSKRNVRRPSHETSRSLRKDAESSKSSPPRPLRNMSTHCLSIPFTPPTADSSAMPSTPTSASLPSLKLSDEDAGSDIASQAMASSGEDDEDTMLDESASFPQLVMPSLQMPSRRPFTTKGKAMGKLKVLVAGQASMSQSFDVILSMLVSDPLHYRYRKDFPHTIHRSTLRRHCACRPSFPFQLSITNPATKAKVPEEEGWIFWYKSHYRDSCKHKIIPAMVDRC